MCIYIQVTCTPLTEACKVWMLVPQSRHSIYSQSSRALTFHILLRVNVDVSQWVACVCLYVYVCVFVSHTYVSWARTEYGSAVRARTL